jgi:hypothetical protein
MTDLTQAKQVAQRLRDSGYPETYVFTDIPHPAHEAISTIDALVEEVETLRDSCAAKADRIDRLGETVERLTKVDVEPVREETHCPHGAELYDYCKLCDMEVSEQLSEDVEPSTTDSANRSADSAKPFCNNDLTPNHLCKGYWVHLPCGEQCDKCGGEQK